MLFNLLTDLTDPDNTPSGYGGLDLNNGGWVVISVLLIIILALIFIIFFLYLKLDKYKQQDKENNPEQLNAGLSEEEQQTIAAYRKLSEQERKIIDDTIKTFNKTKSE